MPIFFGNYTAFVLDYIAVRGINMSQVSDELLGYRWLYQIRYEIQALMKFYFGIAKCVGYPVGLLLQVLTVIFLIRGNSGYSRSAKNWFLLVLGADIASVLFHVYELISTDFRLVNPMKQLTYNEYFGQQFLFMLWGLRRLEDDFLQGVICKIFFIILYFPVHLSPIALTVSSLVRSYCVKFPLKAKAVLTTRVDRCLMAFTVLLSLAIAVIIGALVADGWSNKGRVKAFDLEVYYGDCTIPRYDFANTDKGLVFIGLTFMMAVIFSICAFNLLSAIVIIFVLFEAKKSRKSMSATEGPNSNVEFRATAMLLGMNIVLFICFFLSRLFVVVSTRIDPYVDPAGYAALDRVGAYLFNIPYYTNWLFIAGFSSKFYEFYLPCIFKKETKTTSAVSQKTMEESKIR